jgi:hypothetical protein
MFINKLAAISSTVIITVGLAACGGGSSTSTPTSSNTRLIAGTITGFGSIHMNDEHILTDGSTSYSVDGEPDDGSGLDVGNHARVCTEVQSDGSLLALSVISNDELEGLVTSVPAEPCPTSGSLTVLGVTVNYGAELVLEGAASVCVLVAGTTFVEVHGNPGPNGIVATKIEVESSGDDTEVKGTITAVAADTVTLNGNIEIDYSTAEVEGLELDAGGFITASAVGKYVEAKLDPATFAETAMNSGEWMATALKIELEDDSFEECGTEDGDEAEIEGVVTRGLGDDNGTPDNTADDLGPDQFEVDSEVIVQLNAALFADDSVTALIVVGDEIEAEGTYDANGVLVAREIEEEESGDDEHTGNVTSIVEQGGSAEPLRSDNYVATKTYVVTLDGGTGSEKSFVVKPTEVIMDDSTDVYGDDFDLTHLLIGSPLVEIYYFTEGDTNIATKIELKD